MTVGTSTFLAAVVEEVLLISQVDVRVDHVVLVITGLAREKWWNQHFVSTVFRRSLLLEVEDVISRV